MLLNILATLLEYNELCNAVEQREPKANWHDPSDLEQATSSFWASVSFSAPADIKSDEPWDFLGKQREAGQSPALELADWCESYLCHWVAVGAVWPGISHLTSLRLSIYLCAKGIRCLSPRVMKRFRLVKAQTTSGEGISPGAQGRSGDQEASKVSEGGWLAHEEVQAGRGLSWGWGWGSERRLPGKEKEKEL